MRKYIGLVLMLIMLIILPGCSNVGEHPDNNPTANLAAQKAVASPWRSYQNEVDGYQVEFPSAWNLDSSKEGVVTRLAASDNMAIIDIYAQILDQASANDYLAYSNRHIINEEHGVKLLEQNHNKVNNMKACSLMWERPKLNNRPNDLNVYREVDLIFPTMVYTLILKTDQAHLAQYKTTLNHLAQSFKRIDVVSKPNSDPARVTPWDIKLQGHSMQVQIPWNKMMFGIFNPLFSPYKDLPKAMDKYRDYENSLGYKFEFIMTYTDFYHGFPTRLAADTYSDRRIMMFTWAPFMETGTNSVIIPNIVNGEYDTYLSEWAKQVKQIEEPVFVRFANEMNGDWDPWCAWFFSKDTDLYVEAWRHIYKIFRQEGVDNAIFVWNPHDRSFPNFKWNSAELYYPGSEYVDWVGLTCYNNGTGYPHETWREFNDMYKPIYDEYLSKYPGKPFLITEFSSSELGGDKKAWIEDCMKSLKNYPNIRIAVWYDSTDGKRLYRIDSTPESKEAFRLGLSNPYFLRYGIKITGK